MRLFSFLILALPCTPAVGQDFFKVNLTNTSPAAPPFPWADVFLHEDMVDQRPLGPGESGTVVLPVVPGIRFSFAAQFVESNDLFFAPDEKGIALMGEDGPVTGNLTGQVFLWDAGTEANEEPGLGPNQPMRQSDANTGPADGDNTVRKVSDEFDYPEVGEVLRVSVGSIRAMVGIPWMQINFENVSTGETLTLSDGTTKGVPVIVGPTFGHFDDGPLFTPGIPDRRVGLEALAEDGQDADLQLYVFTRTGIPHAFAPGVWTTHKEPGPIFADGIPDQGMGLEALAEDGNPLFLANSLGRTAALTTGIFAVPKGTSQPGPIASGGSYEFVVSAKPGASLSLATMVVQTNDYFVAPGQEGIPLYDDAGGPISGDLFGKLLTWDAGTEEDQFPGFGNYQAPRQQAPNAGPPDPEGRVRFSDDLLFGHLLASAFLRLSVEPLETVPFRLKIDNISGESGTPVPLAPGLAVVHSGLSPLFFADMNEPMFGLESLAEDGIPAMLAETLEASAGFSPAVFAVPDGATDPGPLLPGQSYTVTVDGAVGTYLSFASMYVESNDLFFAPGEAGIPLFDQDGMPTVGDITEQIMLWDAGTEMNEEPGVGENQAPRQASPNTGPADANSTVRLVNDGFTYLPVNELIKVSVLPVRTSTEDQVELPDHLALYPNYPNPFNPETSIAFDLPERSVVHLAIYNALGQHVIDLANREMAAGTHELRWDGRNASGQYVATGVYIYRLESGTAATSRTMLLVK